MSETTGSATGGETAALVAFQAMRTSSPYQAGERRRRAVGAVVMANSDPMTEEHAGVRLLIGTWDAIGSTVRGSTFDLNRIFQTQPICHMWAELKPAVDIFRARFGPEYAANFEWLDQAFQAWVEPRGIAYRTQACNGMHAMFG